MLSISNVSGGSAQSGYYKAEGYYLEGSQEAEAGAQYFGKAAEEAGLTGHVDDQQFTRLLEGEAPSGQIMGRVLADGTRQHRPGIDLTFSAPKGVSIAALVGGDIRVIEAHTDAVKSAMSYVESDLVQTRTKRNGEITVHTGGKIIAGLFQHDTSRALDPQLHTHAVIANMIQGSDGGFKALHNDLIYQNKMVVGQAYRNALAQNLERLGYTIERQDKGLFDIKEIPKELVETFSKRREEIVKALDARNLAATPENSALAALATRSSKKPVARDELRAAWSAEVEKSGHDLAKLRPAPQHDREQSEAAQGIKHHDPAPSVEFATMHLAERASVYERSVLVETALKHDHNADVKYVQAYVDHLVERKVLFPVEVDGKAQLTDTMNIALEKDSIRQLTRGRVYKAIDVRTRSEKVRLQTNEGALSARLQKTTLTEGQKDAVKLGLSSKEQRFVGVQGLAGTGKTFMLRTLAQYAGKIGYEVHGIAPTLKAVEALSEAIPESRTIDSALVMAQHRGTVDPDQKSILVVDEASMVSTQRMNDVLRLANSAKYDRVILVGDIKQLEAVGAGSPFRLLQRNGLNVALMSDIQRQRTEEGRQAVLHAYAGEIRDAFSNINPVIETPAGDGRQERRANIAEAMAKDYLERTPEHRDVTGMVVLTNEMRKMVNEAVQSGLVDAGQLKGAPTELATLLPRNFTYAEAREVGSYQPGDIVTTTRDIARHEIEAKVLYTVTKVDTKNRALTLTDPEDDSRKIPMGPDDKAASNFIVYKADTQSVYAGDKVKFKITDRDHGIINAATGTVTAASKDSVTIRDADGRDNELPTGSMAVRGMQLAYASTAHDFQGASIDQVLVGLDSSEQLATQKAFYVSVSRMTEATQIYTDDAGKLASTIERHTGERINALEALDGEKYGTIESRKSTLDERRDQPVIEVRDAPEKSRDPDALREAENTAKDSAEKQAEKPSEKTPDRDGETDPVRPDQTHDKDRADPRIQEDLFARLVEQMPNQMHRGDRER